MTEFVLVYYAFGGEDREYFYSAREALDRSVEVHNDGYSVVKVMDQEGAMVYDEQDLTEYYLLVA